MKYKSIIKLGISLLLLAFVLSRTDLVRLEAVLFSVPWWLVPAVVLGYAAGQLISSYKWWIIARQGGIPAPFGTAAKSYFIGMFVNCFGLGVVGGDVVRGLLLAGKSPRSVALASVVADRAHGLGVLAVMATLALGLFGVGSLDANWLYFLLVVGLSIVTAWLAGPPLLMWCTRGSRRFGSLAQQIARVFPKRMRTVLYITIISVLFHLLQIGLHWLMALGLGADIPWRQLLVAVPFVNILSSLPISWNGLGVRENAYKFFLVPALLSTEQAVAWGALWLLAVLASSCVGGVAALISGDIELVRRRPLTAETEETPPAAAVNQ